MTVYMHFFSPLQDTEAEARRIYVALEKLIPGNKDQLRYISSGWRGPDTVIGENSLNPTGFVNSFNILENGNHPLEVIHVKGHDGIVLVQSPQLSLGEIRQVLKTERETWHLLPYNA